MLNYMELAEPQHFLHLPSCLGSQESTLPYSYLHLLPPDCIILCHSCTCILSWLWSCLLSSSSCVMIYMLTSFLNCTHILRLRSRWLTNAEQQINICFLFHFWGSGCVVLVAFIIYYDMISLFLFQPRKRTFRFQDWICIHRAAYFSDMYISNHQIYNLRDPRH